MKATFEDIKVKKGMHSFLAFRFTAPGFPFKWHYHPEYELTLIESGCGKRLVGDSLKNFESGDLVLLGPELPHTWESVPANQKKKCTATVIQFSDEFMKPFIELSEFKDVKKLLTDCRRGLYFKTGATEAMMEVKTLAEETGPQRVIRLLHLLSMLSGLRSQPLTSSYFHPVKGVENENRINQVCGYVLRNFSKDISVNDAAKQIHLSSSAFCKFFKRTTGKTFSDYVNEIRISQACTLLTETDRTIADIAWASGFESITYFNRVFKRKKVLTPVLFRKRR
ncbi:MAG: AraC family transcriptional regulator [Chitinophagaceae bacterium]|nr:AraC family transcriptional regulator [Chitinophagaceae bacterium]